MIELIIAFLVISSCFFIAYKRYKNSIKKGKLYAWLTFVIAFLSSFLIISAIIIVVGLFGGGFGRGGTSVVRYQADSTTIDSFSTDSVHKIDSNKLK